MTDSQRILRAFNSAPKPKSGLCRGHETNWLMDDPKIKTGSIEESLKSFDKILKKRL